MLCKFETHLPTPHTIIDCDMSCKKAYTGPGPVMCIELALFTRSLGMRLVSSVVASMRRMVQVFVKVSTV